jgi:uncharacterized membrane protein (DUF2068 family)
MRTAALGAMSTPTDRARSEGLSPTNPASDRAVRLIALFKFGKAGLLVLVAAGALGLVRPATAAHAEQAITALAASGNHRLLPRALSHLLGLPSRQLEALGAGALLYAGLFLVEGVGLWRGRRWGEYLTVIATASLVPLELLELSRRSTTLRVLALALNVVIVGYLIGRLRRRRTGTRAVAA